MKKGLLIPALIMLAPTVAIAETSHSGLFMGPTLQVRGGGGGAELETITYTNGDTQTIRGGNGLELAAGWHIQPYRNSPFDLRAQVGYKYYGTRADNADIYMDRFTWELIPSVQFGAGFWGGVGLLMHTNIKLHNDGFLPDAKFKNALGADFQLGWRWLALTYTNMKYEYEGTGQKFSANSLGLQFTYSFGWTCCGGTDQRSSRSGRSAPAPVYSAAVPAPVYAPAVEPAPAAAPPPPAPVVMEPAPVVAPPVVVAAPAPTPAAAPTSTIGSAQAIPGAVLRSGPSMKAEGIRTLPDGGSVKLVKREANTEGPWWMVQLDDGTTGWMIEWGLTRISKH